MMDLPIKAEVNGLDGALGHSTYVVGNPVTRQLTHLVVQSNRPPFREYLVPVEQVVETHPDQFLLKCTRDDFYQMAPFEYDEYIQTELPNYICYSDVTLHPGTLPEYIPAYATEAVSTYIPVKRQNIPLGEITLQRGARVEATDGSLGQVDGLLINPIDRQVTHLVLIDRHGFDHQEITLPVSQIDHIDEDAVYLKLDRQSVGTLPKVPTQQPPQDQQEKVHLEKGAYFPLRFSSEGIKMDFKSRRRNMMDKMIVVVFDNELKAYEGSKALQELQNEGSINLYAKVVIARDASGKVAVKQQGDMGPVGTSVGLLTGSLIGLLGGPVGAALGAYAGAVGGMFFDLGHLTVGEDFLSEVEHSLLPGKAAVVAEVWEEWTTPVDTRMETLGGVVFRRSSGDVFDAQVERDIAALKADLAELEAERNQATGETRAKLQAKVDAAKTRLIIAKDAIQAKIETTQKETEAKINSLQEQATKESGERKAKREARIAELKAKQKQRSELLKKAWELAREALYE